VHTQILPVCLLIVYIMDRTSGCGVNRVEMRALLAMKTSPSTALAALGAFFVIGLMFDLRALADELGYQHRLMACLGMYELKANISDEDPRTICNRALVGPVAADFD